MNSGEQKEPKPPINLSQWLQNENLVEEGWMSMEEFASKFGVNFERGNKIISLSQTQNTENGEPRMSMGRIIDLGIQILDYFVSLIVRLTPEPDGKFNILLQLHPARQQTTLPPGAQMAVLDDTGNVFLEAESRQADNWIQLEFIGLPGERFTVKITVGEASLTESFLI